VECHFCGLKQSVHESETNKFFCVGCQQYNGFNSDGDYNIVRPELFVEELNPKPSAKGEFRVTSNTTLCERCDKKNAQWLAQDRELNWALCPDCAFAVKEAVSKSVVKAKTQYLAASVIRGGLEFVGAPKVGLGRGVRALIVLTMLACLALLSLGALASVIPHYWFFASELIVALEVVLFLGLNALMHMADAEWRSGWMVGVCVVFVLMFAVAGVPKRLVIGAVVGAWCAVLGLLGARMLSVVKDVRRRRRESAELQRMTRPVASVGSEVDAGDADEDLPWQIGVAGKGWSSRKAAFEFKPGDRGPGAPLAGQKTTAPTPEELAVESLLSGFSIMGDEERPASGSVVAVAGARAFQFWREAPRMTLGSLAAAVACRVVFLDKDWSGAVCAAFLISAASAVHLETNLAKRMHVSAGLVLLALGQVLPWRLLATLAWSNVEIIVIVSVFVLLVLARNKK
jgi:hypothetical protein